MAPMSLGVALLAGCGAEQVQSAGDVGPPEPIALVDQVDETQATELPIEEQPVDETPTGEPEEHVPEQIPTSWLDGVDLEIVAIESQPESHFQLWLLRLDESQARSFGTALGTEATRLRVTDDEGSLAQLATGNWLGRDVPEDLISLDLLLNGGLFGEYNPEPAGPNGETVLFGLVPGDLGQESPDQIQYFLGSSPRVTLLPAWEQLVIDLLPELSESESLVTVAIFG